MPGQSFGEPKSRSLMGCPLGTKGSYAGAAGARRRVHRNRTSGFNRRLKAEAK